MEEDEMSQSAEPWNQPDEATQAAAQPIKEELQEALQSIDTMEKAEALIARLESDSAGQGAVEVAEAAPDAEGAAAETQTEVAADAVEQAADAGEQVSELDEAAAAIEAIAAEVAELDGPAYEAVVAAVQEVTNPALTGEPEALERPRRYLRDTIMKRMSFFQKYDTALFIAINNGLHTRALNKFFQYLSVVFNGGWAWIIGVALFWPFRRRRATLILKRISVPIWVAALVIEGPVKKYFRRKRPFIDVVRAIVVGKKPGNWSFPSGHGAAAFAGARMMSHELPRWKALWYSIALLVGFSRVYLGAHYPGDVMSGSLIGVIFSEVTRSLMKRYGWWAKK